MNAGSCSRSIAISVTTANSVHYPAGGDCDAMGELQPREYLPPRAIGALVSSRPVARESEETYRSSPKRLDQVRAAIRTRHYSHRTEEAYIGWVRRFILFHRRRHPAEMDKTETSAFLTPLAVDRKVAASTQNQALAAILFLYKEAEPRRWSARDEQRR